MSGRSVADPHVGRDVAGYRIEAVVGRGGMGVVYRAHDLALDRKVALKLVAPDLADDTRFRERFLRESRVAASIDHANVIPIHDAGESRDGELYIAMRLVEGTDLAEVLSKEGRLEPERALALLGQVASALDAAHARGLVHRDVKPANVLITEEEGRGEHVYLSDFGLARESGEREPGDTDEQIVLKASGSLGTIDYASPEQIEGRPVDARTDVYSLGCVLYECMVGRPPFDSESPLAVLFGHLTKPPPDLAAQHNAMPPHVGDAVSRALAKDPAARYESCGGLVADAERSDPDESSGLSRRRWPLAAAIGVLIVAAGVVAALALTGGTDPATGDEWTAVSGSEAVFGGVRGFQQMNGVTSTDDGLIAAVGWDDAGGDRDAAVLFSADGVRWERAPIDGTIAGGQANQAMFDVIGTDSGLLAVGDSVNDFDRPDSVADATVWRSTDGREWERLPSSAGLNPPRDCAPVGPNRMNAVAIGGPGLVAVGQSTCGEPAVWVSADGTDWGQILVAGVETETGRSLRAVMTDVSEIGSGLVAVGWLQENAAAWISTDGLSWQPAPAQDALAGVRTERSLEINAVAELGELLVAVGADFFTEAGAIGSAPGSSLSEPDNALRADLEADGAVWLSEDGLAWTRVVDEQGVFTGDGDEVMTDVNVVDGTLVAVGFRKTDGEVDAAVWLSDDGSTWRDATDPSGALVAPDRQFMTAVTERDGTLVAVGGQGAAFDIDAAAWTSP